MSSFLKEGLDSIFFASLCFLSISTTCAPHSGPPPCPIPLLAPLAGRSDKERSLAFVRLSPWLLLPSLSSWHMCFLLCSCLAPLPGSTCSVSLLAGTHSTQHASVPFGHLEECVDEFIPTHQICKLNTMECRGGYVHIYIFFISRTFIKADIINTHYWSLRTTINKSTKFLEGKQKNEFFIFLRVHSKITESSKRSSFKSLHAAKEIYLLLKDHKSRNFPYPSTFTFE